MRIHYIQHVPYEGLACIEKWAFTHNHSISESRIYESVYFPAQEDFDSLIVMGGPMGVYETGSYPWLIEEIAFIKETINSGKKILGICLGAQLLAAALGAKVYKHKEEEIGWFDITPATENNFFSTPQTVLHWHGDTFDIPADSTLLCTSEATPHQGFVYKNQVLGLQFHLEMTEDSLIEMLKAHADSLITSTFVQDAQQILENVHLLEKTNKKMKEILNLFF